VDDTQCVYTQYNLYTPTSRPSNRFGNVNYAALNKKTGDRDCFVSRYGNEGALVMMDYESYHLRLFGNHVKFDLPDEPLHGYLGKLYHGKGELTEDEYDLSKKITFNLIYGGITDDVRDNVPFMARIAEFVDETWKFYKKHGYVSTWLYGRKLMSSIFDDKTNSYKVFNYLLQAAETERNCMVLADIFGYLDNKKTKCVLYTYDAFLFDVPSDEFINTRELRDIMDPSGDYPIRTYVGANYGDLREIIV
jgi:DNA polymerase I-like protein with 3'-5' exonuclease and polymerase domains